MKIELSALINPVYNELNNQENHTNADESIFRY